MTLSEFEKAKQLDEQANLWFAKKDERTFVRPVNPRRGPYKCPSYLRQFESTIVWEIGPAGKKLLIGNLQIT